MDRARCRLRQVAVAEVIESQSGIFKTVSGFVPVQRPPLQSAISAAHALGGELCEQGPANFVHTRYVAWPTSNALTPPGYTLYDGFGSGAIPIDGCSVPTSALTRPLDGSSSF